MKERRSAYLRENLQGKWASWALVGATVFFLIEGVSIQSWRLIVGGIALTALVIFVVSYVFASRRAAGEYFAELAPQLGLEYRPVGDYAPITPLLSAGDRRRYEHAMVGPLYGKLGGPRCLLAHYTAETQRQINDDVSHWRKDRFTVCAIDSGAPMIRFRGLYLQPRLSGLGLDHNWLSRAPKPEKVKLESEQFGQLYELYRTSDQDEIALRELFSPSLVVWLNEHPLRPGFECKAGTLVVYIRGHEESAGKITMLLETARSLARRLHQQVNQGGSGDSGQVADWSGPGEAGDWNESLLATPADQADYAGDWSAVDTGSLLGTLSPVDLGDLPNPF
jgi:hypothetical protein